MKEDGFAYVDQRLVQGVSDCCVYMLLIVRAGSPVSRQLVDRPKQCAVRFCEA